MDGRIGALHVRYRIPPGSATAAALAPGLDRAIRGHLGEAVAERMSLALGSDPSVIVIRELETRVALDSRDLVFDSRALERISRASVDAVTDLLHESDTPDIVMRFADEAEFIGSFLLDLLQGTAWDRWYFGAFQSYRRGSVRESVAAVLADHQKECARVFAWLERRGRLREVTDLLGSGEARRLVSGRSVGSGIGALADIDPLLEAAFALVETLGWPRTDPDARRSVLMGFLSGAALPPSWGDRRALSAWVFECARAIVGVFSRSGKPRPEVQTLALAEKLLGGSLDWLDGAWLVGQLPQLLDDAGANPSATRTGTRLLSASHERMLARLARRIAERRVRPYRAGDRDGLVVRLVAAIADEADQNAALDRAPVAAIERIVDAWAAAQAADDGAAMLLRMLQAPGRTLFPAAAPMRAELRSRVDAVIAAGAAAVDVLRALAGATIDTGEVGEPTEFAGLYLLTRGVLDIRLSMHAKDTNVPFDLLRGALAAQWLGVSRPFDTPTALWLGMESEDLAGLAECATSLADFERSMLATLLDQRAFDGMPPESSDSVAAAPALVALGCPAPQAAVIARIAWMVMRAWSRWLPGVAQASPAFLTARALVRGGRVRVADSRIDVALEPAALDVVLDMAGYFNPIESVPWLGGRTVGFTVGRTAGS